MKLLSKPATKPRLALLDITWIALSAAILLVAQVVLAPLANVELVSLLVMLYALVFRWRVYPIIYIFAVLEGMIYGFHLWWFMYLYVWTILAFVVQLMGKRHSVFVWAAVSGMYGLLFGALCAIVYLFVGGVGTMFAFWISGIPFDVVHGIANFVLCLVLWKPLFKVLELINRNHLHNQHALSKE